MVTDKGFDLEWSHLPQSIGSGNRDCGLEVERPALPWSSVVNRCAIYTRKSSDEGLEQGFNSLDAQREACEGAVRLIRTNLRLTEFGL